MKSTEQKTSIKQKAHGFYAELKAAVVGVARLAFISATGIAGYILWFSSNSLTLKVVAVVLAVRVAYDALAMSTRK